MSPPRGPLLSWYCSQVRDRRTLQISQYFKTTILVGEEVKGRREGGGPPTWPTQLPGRTKAGGTPTSTAHGSPDKWRCTRGWRPCCWRPGLTIWTCVNSDLRRRGSPRSGAQRSWSPTSNGSGSRTGDPHELKSRVRSDFRADSEPRSASFGFYG